MSVIQVNNLNKKFDGKIALSDVSFTIREGEIFGFLGPSGSGKTTTINILTNQLIPDSGYVKIFNKNSQELEKGDFKQIGIVSDTVGYYEKMTLYKNIEFYARFHEVPLIVVDNLLKRLELWGARNKKAEQLSTGMKQRMLLIRAIIHKPKVLFLDEPTSGLDPNLAKIVHEVLLELKNEGMTIFLTTHNMNEATKLCNEISLLYNGEIVEDGTIADILEKHSKKDDTVRITYLNGDTKIINRKELSNYFSSQVKGIDSGEVTLEDVFIKLTGESLDE